MPGGTMVQRLLASRSMRSMAPSFWLGTPMSVQYKWPAAASMTMPSGWRQLSSSSLRSLPSGWTVRMRLPLRSSTYSRPSAAGEGWFMAFLVVVGGWRRGRLGRGMGEVGRPVFGEGGARLARFRAVQARQEDGAFLVDLGQQRRRITHQPLDGGQRAGRTLRQFQRHGARRRT